jgi:hypothetical protein
VNLDRYVKDRLFLRGLPCLYPMDLVTEAVGPAGPITRVNLRVGIALLLECRASAREALLPASVGASRFVIRATHERGVGVPSSRSLPTTSHEAFLVYLAGLTFQEMMGRTRRRRSLRAWRRLLRELVCVLLR